MCEQFVGHATKAMFHEQFVELRSFNLNCNKWSCESCAKRKAIILANRVREGFKGERIRFATFTDKGEGSFSTRLKNLKSAWNRLRLDLCRKYGLTKFFWVLEFGHEHGRPHLHCLLNCYIPQRKLSELAARAGFGRIVDIREVKTGGGFGYVFKYLHKDCGSAVGARALASVRGRRFGLSRNIKPLKNDTVSACLLAYCRQPEPGGFLKIEAEILAHCFGPRVTCTKWNGSSAVVRVDGPNILYKSPEAWQRASGEHTSWEQVVARVGGCVDRATYRWALNSTRNLNRGKCTTLLGGVTYSEAPISASVGPASVATAWPS